MRTAARILLLALLLLPAVALAQMPGATAGVPRVTVDAGILPWSALVRVQAPGLARCTGFMVAPDLVATAAHCLYSRRLGRFIPPGSVNVLRGYVAGRHAGHAVARGYRTASGYDPRRTDATRGADVALVQLATPLPGPVLALANGDAGPELVLGGYQQDRAEVIAADLGCRLVGMARDAAGRRLLAHGCTATRGSSGAPLLTRGSAGEWQVLGIQSGGRAGGGGVAVPVSALQGLLDPGA